jgi:hypothetical protein
VNDDSLLSRPIDVWDVETFDEELRNFLAQNAELISAYWAESSALHDAREKQTLRGPPEHNSYGPRYSALKEAATALLADRAIRAWHFTRLTDAETDLIRMSGMAPMSLEIIRRRLDALVAATEITAAIADELFAASPYHQQIDGNREGRIWLTSVPYPLDDSGVTELLDAWGGESINFNHRDGSIQAMLRTLGLPRVIEVALPLSITTRADCAAVNVLDAYARSIGTRGGWGGGCDIVAVSPIQPGWILSIHSPGDPAFAAMGRDYPGNFVPNEE